MRGIESRRSFSNDRIGNIKERLEEIGGGFEGQVCVYATGSYGRREACTHSDLDLFLVGGTQGEEGRPWLSRLDEICLKAKLIEMARDLGLPEFSGDGEFLQFHTTKDLVGALGTSTDDSRNSFTAR